jgi:hypothetical protein
MQNVKYKWVRFAFVAIGVLIFLFALWFPEWARKSVKQDRESALPQQGVATVAMLIDAKPSVTGKPSPAQVLVRFRGGIYPVKSILGFDALHENQPAQIVYRVGKSGRVYVDSVAPLTAPSAASSSERGSSQSQ